MGTSRTPPKRPTSDDPRVVARHMAAIREDVRRYLLSEGDDFPFPQRPEDRPHLRVPRDRVLHASDGPRIGLGQRDGASVFRSPSVLLFLGGLRATVTECGLHGVAKG
jgi:hypothetical protein